jgi:FK506-binding nuclear protein
VSSRFEEIVVEPKTKKRPAEKMDVDEKPTELTKAEKKAAKKQKGENGVAIPKEDTVKGTKGDKKEEKKDEKKDEKKEKRKEKKEKKKEAKAAGEVKEVEGGVQVRDVKIGSGPGAQKGQSVKMRYIGKLTDGKVFDSNTKGKPVSSILKVRQTFEAHVFLV